MLPPLRCHHPHFRFAALCLSQCRKYWHPKNKEEVKMAMEDASGSLIFRNWVDVRTLILMHFKHKLSMLGTKTQALFSRDEYQPQSGNVCHEHLAIALDRSTMSDAWAASKIQGLYRMHSAKCSADCRMLERGLLFFGHA